MIPRQNSHSDVSPQGNPQNQTKTVPTLLNKICKIYKARLIVATRDANFLTTQAPQGHPETTNAKLLRSKLEQTPIKISVSITSGSPRCTNFFGNKPSPKKINLEQHTDPRGRESEKQPPHPACPLPRKGDTQDQSKRDEASTKERKLARDKHLGPTSTLQR